MIEVTGFDEELNTHIASLIAPTITPIGAKVDLKAQPDTVRARCDLFREAPTMTIELDDRNFNYEAYHRIKSWLLSTTARFDCPQSMHPKKGRTLVLSNWVGEANAAYILLFEPQSLFTAMRTANFIGCQEFVDLGAARVVAALWGRSGEEMRRLW